MNYIKQVNTTKTQVVTHAFQYTASTILARVILMLATFLIASVLGPSGYGKWNIITIAMTYSTYLQLGTLSALQREVPFYIGQGNDDFVDKIRGVVFTFIVLISLLSCFVCLVIPPFVIKKPDFYLVLWFIPPLILQLFFLFSQTYLRSINYFGSLCITDLLNAMIFLCFIFFFAKNYGIISLLIGLSIAYMTNILYFVKKTKFIPKLLLDYSLLLTLIKIGVSIMGLGLLSTLFFSLDRMFIAGTYGTEILGYYGMGMTVFGIVNIVPGIFSQLIYPRMAEQYGRSNSNIHSLSNYLFQPIYILAIMLPLFLCVIYFIYPLFISLYLPSFLPSIAVSRILIMGAFFVSISGLFSDFLIVINKQYFLYVAKIVSLTICLLLMSLIAWFKYSYLLIAMVVSISYLIYSIIIIGFSLNKMQYGMFRIVAECIRIMTPFTIICIIIFFVTKAVYINSCGVYNYLVQMLFVITIYLPVLFISEKKHRPLSIIGHSIIDILKAKTAYGK